MASGCKAEREEVTGGSEGRKETDWDAWTDVLGSLVHSQLGEQKLSDMLLKLKRWMRRLDIIGFDHTALGIFSLFSAALKENGESTAESVTRNCSRPGML